MGTIAGSSPRGKTGGDVLRSRLAVFGSAGVGLPARAFNSRPTAPGARTRGNTGYRLCQERTCSRRGDPVSGYSATVSFSGGACTAFSALTTNGVQARPPNESRSATTDALKGRYSVIGATQPMSPLQRYGLHRAQPPTTLLWAGICLPFRCHKELCWDLSPFAAHYSLFKGVLPKSA